MVLWVLVPTNSFSSSDRASGAPYTRAVTLTIPIGVVYPIRMSRVWSTGTDSTTTVALY